MPKAKSRVVFVPLYAAAVATGLFFAQGGFGGGHGMFDGIIVCLVFPSILAISVMPLPEFVLYYDYLFLIALPALANFALLWLGLWCVRFLKRAKAEKHWSAD
ncbi:MAG: hypothetical protein K2X03_01805 [Bryobacteraceae bacterium]|nr:hypothetical protein [Bryobacteraceae bacterium]